MERLDGKRVLVVGASKGLGRAIGRRLHREGASVALAARSKELIDEVVAECGPGAHGIVCDVQDPERCAATVAEAVSALGGLDGLVYSTGMTVFTHLQAASADDWRRVFETNVFGAALITAAAMPHLEATSGAAVFLSSESAAGIPPWLGLGLYTASKAALEKSVQTWNLEHPTVRCTTVVVGATGGTEFAVAGGIDAIGPFAADWAAKGHVGANQLEPEDQAEAVANVLASRAQIDVIWVRPPGAGVVRTALPDAPPV